MEHSVEGGRLGEMNAVHVLELRRRRGTYGYFMSLTCPTIVEPLDARKLVRSNGIDWYRSLNGRHEYRDVNIKRESSGGHIQCTVKNDIA
jgi:hypothetical protein